MGTRWSSSLETRHRKRDHRPSRNSQRKSRKRKTGRQTNQYQRPASAIVSVPPLGTKTEVAPFIDSDDPKADHNTTATRHAASGIQEFFHRTVRAISESSAGRADPVTMFDFTIVATKARILGSTHVSQTKHRGMTSSSRTCPAIAESEKIAAPCP